MSSEVLQAQGCLQAGPAGNLCTLAHTRCPSPAPSAGRTVEADGKPQFHGEGESRLLWRRGRSSLIVGEHGEGSKALWNLSKKEENLPAISRVERHPTAPSHPQREHIPLHPLPYEPATCPCALHATPDTPRVSKTSYVCLRAGSQGLQGAALSAHDMPVCSARHFRHPSGQQKPATFSCVQAAKDCRALGELAAAEAAVGWWRCAYDRGGRATEILGRGGELLCTTDQSRCQHKPDIPARCCTQRFLACAQPAAAPGWCPDPQQ